MGLEESIMEPTTELTLEEEFSLRSFATQVQQMSREQAQEFLIVLNQQMVLREKLYREFLRHEWKLDQGFDLSQES
jgi:hypothetical protein